LGILNLLIPFDQSMKEGCLFVLFVMLRDLPNHGASCHTLGIIGKCSMSRSAYYWFHNVSTYGGEVIE
jgi:hypothetical protein